MGKRRNGAVGGLISAVLSGAIASAACAPDRIDIRTVDGLRSYQIEIADTTEERAQGLMFREEMAQDHGMLFVYPSAREVAFWMKNTPLPLDIIYINQRGVICSIAANTPPFSETAIPSNCAAQTVLEVNAGEAAASGLRIGAPVRHPAVANPVWTCE